MGLLFTSYEFIGFLLILFLAYYILPKKCQWPLLLLASYLFYCMADVFELIKVSDTIGFSWDLFLSFIPRFRYFIYILFTTISTFLFSRLIENIQNKKDEYLKTNKENLSKDEKKAYKEKNKKQRFTLMLICLLINLGVLAFTKYTNFTIHNINTFLDESKAIKPLEILIPLGISFYTFQSLGYLIDVYRGKQKACENFFKFALFVSFFPQLIQGPISRYSDLSETLFTEHKFEMKNISYGLMRILWGYFKKMVIADRIIVAVNCLIKNPDAYGGLYVFVAMLFYAFELYCDFTGGIDITIGIAEVLGIKVTENFNLPYFSKNIKEYWNRWHITMGSWFTDYIFYPVSVCGPMLKLSKWSRKHLGQTIGKRVSVYLSCFIVWFTTGLWHGASWNFIVWGLMNFVVIMISQELEPLYRKFHGRFNVKTKSWYGVFEIIRTILLMSMIRMFDCYRDVPLTFKMVFSMFTTFNFKIFADGSLLQLGIDGSDYIVLAVGFLIILLNSIYKAKGNNIRDKLYKKPSGFTAVICILFIIIIVFGAYGIGYDSNQFIYNQF